jgi:DNA modification methylase
MKTVKFIPTKKIKRGFSFSFENGAVKRAISDTNIFHSYPAKFIPQIPEWAIKYSSLKQKSLILDPFAGSGTTLLQSSLMGHRSVGIDINPLSEVISKAKTHKLINVNYEILTDDLKEIISKTKREKEIKDFIINPEKYNLHFTWNNWFSKDIMEKILRLKKIILNYNPTNPKLIKDRNVLKNFYLNCFSSMLKKSSYLSEKEIKVRKDPNKKILNPLLSFEKIVKKNFKLLIILSKELKKKNVPNPKFHLISATKIPDIYKKKVDLIVTSPPYINAIDYTMAHKYNLFSLNLIKAKNFKEHCREYIGITERAVLKKNYENINLTKIHLIDNVIKDFIYSKNSVDKIRGFIIKDYFLQMLESLKKMHAVLKTDSKCIIIIGDNHIRGKFVETSKIIQDLAIHKVGFKLENYLFHVIKNRKLKVKRNTSGGIILKERIIILKK